MTRWRDWTGAAALLALLSAGAAKGDCDMGESETAVKVRVHAEDDAAMSRIASELERAGLRIRQRLPELGLFTGDIDPARVNSLINLDGVDAVEPEGSVQLPPLNRDTPQ